MVNKHKYEIFLLKLRISDIKYRVFYYDWEEFLDDCVDLDLYVNILKRDFDSQGFAAHAKEVK